MTRSETDLKLVILW